MPVLKRGAAPGEGTFQIVHASAVTKFGPVSVTITRQSAEPS